MAKKDDDFLKKLLATFKLEAAEHLKAMTSGLLDLEQAATAEKQGEVVEALFRESHSLKGAARAVNQAEVEATCQSLEDVFAAWKRGEVAPSAELFDSLHRTVDELGKLLSAPEAERPAGQQSNAAPIRRLLDTGRRSGRKGGRTTAGKEKASAEAQRPFEHSVTAPPAAPAPTPRFTDTVRIATTKLDSLLLEAEELLSAKLAAVQSARELKKIAASVSQWKKEWEKFWVPQSTIRNPEWPDFLESGRARIGSLEAELAELAKSDVRDTRSLGQLVDNLLDDMKKVLMLPFSWLLGIFPKFVRDLSRDQGKEVDLVLEGAEIEIDRRILEEMKDPLIHLVRNCIDHGIEKPQERKNKGKPSRGKVTISIAQRDSNKVAILVADDGAGIDFEKVREAAAKVAGTGKVEIEKLSDQEVQSLIFQSGVSTSPIITDISGRGLGLAIVREKTEKLGGAVSVETRPGVGTSFELILPMTLATFRGILVRVGQHLFVAPVSSVERVVRAGRGDIQTVENRETLRLDGEAVSLARLGDVLEIPHPTGGGEQAETVPVVVLESGGKRIGFAVEEILDEQEVLVKSLGSHLTRVRNISGATVLGTGRLALILNAPDLIKSAMRAGGPAQKPAAAPAEKEEKKGKTILVVEDSITARALLKNILEAAGYNVKTAVDGVDGFTQLRSGNFDMVVSDVDMPRMNGFDLTAKIRKDKKLAEMPVVLVTALESREDRERGIDVGANAYIVKSSFDQSNLLEAIRRLI